VTDRPSSVQIGKARSYFTKLPLLGVDERLRQSEIICGFPTLPVHFLSESICTSSCAGALFFTGVNSDRGSFEK
jgi:hypothetical protein